MKIVILSVPRIAPVRPSAGVSMLKALCVRQGVDNRVLDLNQDFFMRFAREHSEVSKRIDEYWIQFQTQLSAADQIMYHAWIDHWVDQILSQNSNIIGISVFSWQSQRFTRDLLERLRPEYSGEILIGGQGLVNSQNMSSHWSPACGFAEDLKAEGLIDYWLKGESEETFPRFLRGERVLPGLNNNEIVTLADMDSAPYMDFGDHDIAAYQNGYQDGVLPVESSRGCVRSCSFCEMSSDHGAFRGKSGIALAKEIIYYYETTNCRNYYFHDDLINGDLQELRRFISHILDYYHENNLPDHYFTFSGYWIVRSSRQWSEADFETWYRAGGNTMVTGVETGSDRLRKTMRKGFTNRDLEFTLRCLDKFRMKFYFMLIAGLPGETQEDFQATLDALTRWQRYVASGVIIGVNLGTTATIEPGTDIYNRPEHYNLVGLRGKRPQGINWMCTTTPGLDYRERVRRRVVLQEHVTNLRYPLWKGDDHLSIILDKYKEHLEVWEDR